MRELREELTNAQRELRQCQQTIEEHRDELRDIEEFEAHLLTAYEESLAKVHITTAAVGRLREAQLKEIAALQAPPIACQQVIEFVYWLSKPERTQTLPPWHVMRRKVVSEIVPSVLQGNCLLADAGQAGVVRKKYLEGATALTAEAVARASEVCYVLFMWGLAILNKAEEAAENDRFMEEISVRREQVTERMEKANKDATKAQNQVSTLQQEVQQLETQRKVDFSSIMRLDWRGTGIPPMPLIKTY